MQVKIMCEYTAPDDATHYRMDGDGDVTFFKVKEINGITHCFLAGSNYPMISHRIPMGAVEIKPEDVA